MELGGEKKDVKDGQAWWSATASMDGHLFSGTETETGTERGLGVKFIYDICMYCVLCIVLYKQVILCFVCFEGNCGVLVFGLLEKDNE